MVIPTKEERDFAKEGIDLCEGTTAPIDKDFLRGLFQIIDALEKENKFLKSVQFTQQKKVAVYERSVKNGRTKKNNQR